MNIRLYNAKILTMEKDRPIFNGEIWVRNEKIAYIADEAELEKDWKTKDFPRIAWDMQIDCKGNLLMPGFKDAHSHSAMTFLRSFAEDLPLQEWLQEKVLPLEAKLTEEDIYHLTKLAVLEYLTSGITSIFDMYMDTEPVAEALPGYGNALCVVEWLK